MRKAFIGIVVFVILSCSIKESKRVDLHDLNWLIGSWKRISNDTELYENWKKKNDSTFVGESYLIVNKDTVFFESIVIKQSGKNIYYIPKVSNQNNGSPISFKLISFDSKKFIFENKEHDFPQRIVYKNPQADSLYAYIEGEVNGEYQKSEFRFIRD